MAKRKSNPKRPKRLSGVLQAPRRSHIKVQDIPDLPAIIHQLDIIMATIGVARSALTHQNADIDLDVATVLRRNVMEPLGRLIDQLRSVSSP